MTLSMSTLAVGMVFLLATSSKAKNTTTQKRLLRDVEGLTYTQSSAT